MRGGSPPQLFRATGQPRGAAILTQHAHASARLGNRPQPTAAERAVAQLLPIEADPANARRTRDSVPFWFHTFCLNRAAEIYTPGVARDHRYRLAALPDSFAGQRVLDVGTFDGFYAFLAEARGAERVVAVDNEQYRFWVKKRAGAWNLPAARRSARSAGCSTRRSSTGAWTRSTSRRWTSAST